MELLILGGTRFVGRHVVAAARARGHTVTLFNRGQTNPDLFPDVERLTGDRDGGLSVLEGRGWDAVIDTCGYVPRIVRASAQLLAGAVEHYAFISTLSVYDLSRAETLGEDAPLMALEDESVEEITGDTYGALKVLCERAVEAALPGHTLIVRPGLIVGPHDPTPRFPYWVRRVQRGGEVLAPDSPSMPVQVIDARDLAAWTLDMIERGGVGIYNAAGPPAPLTMGDLLEGVRAALASDATFTWVAEEFLLEHEVSPWSELPLWLPHEMHTLCRADCRKAVAAGLTFRPLVDTVRDTLEWDRARSGGDLGDLPGTLTTAREAELLQAWKARP